MKTQRIFELLMAGCYCLIGSASFTSAANGPAPVNLGTAGDFVILAKAGVSTTGVTSIVGDVGVSPNASTSLTGFSLTLDASSQFATSPQITGKAIAADYAVPSPHNLTTAVSDMELAFTDAAGRSLPDATELGAGNISGMTITPGLYKWGSGVLIASDMTLSGNSNGVWIFQISQNLTVQSGVIITLSGGAQAANIFWQVEGAVDLGTTAHFEGNILSQTAINLKTGASINGRLLAQTAVTLDSNSVNLPSLQTSWNSGETSFQGGWKYLPWFGYYYAPDHSDSGWIMHAQLGWIFPAGSSPESVWFLTNFMGWIWTADSTYPYVWRESDQAWLYFADVPSSELWFYNTQTGEWETY